MYSINIPNTKQNNKIEHINNEINLLQNRLKIKKKSLHQFQNRKNTSKKKEKKKSFSNLKNAKYSEEYNSK